MPTARWSRLLLALENLFVVNLADWGRNLKEKFGDCKKL